MFPLLWYFHLINSQYHSYCPSILILFISTMSSNIWNNSKHSFFKYRHLIFLSPLLWYRKLIFNKTISQTMFIINFNIHIIHPLHRWNNTLLSHQYSYCDITRICYHRIMIRFIIWNLILLNLLHSMRVTLLINKITSPFYWNLFIIKF